MEQTYKVINVSIYNYIQNKSSFFLNVVFKLNHGLLPRSYLPQSQEDSLEELLVMASGSRGRGGGDTFDWGHGKQGLGSFTLGHTGELGSMYPNCLNLAAG